MSREAAPATDPDHRGDCGAGPGGARRGGGGPGHLLHREARQARRAAQDVAPVRKSVTSCIYRIKLEIVW